MNGKLKPKNIKIAGKTTDIFDEFESFLTQNDSNFNLQYPTETPKIRVIDMKKKKHGLF